MRSIGLSIALLLMAVSYGAAQVQVDLALDHDQFLRDESLPVKVRISNLSGQTLHLGKDDQWLHFLVESADGHYVAQKDSPAVAGEFDLDSSLVGTRTIDLMPFFDLERPGRYTVTATLRIPEWGFQTSTRPKTFDVIKGTKIWQQDVGVPSAGGRPVVRRYILLQADFSKRLRLYLRVTDVGGSQVFGVTPVGPLVSFSHPEAQVDRYSNLHILFQDGAHTFLYSMANPEGQVIVRQTFEYRQVRPTLRAGEEGSITVYGGVRKPLASDLPPPELTASSTNTAHVLKP